MKTFFEDNYINKMFFSLMKREVEKEQLNKTIDEINYLNELQTNLLKRYDMAHFQSRQKNLAQNFTNAKRKTNI